MYYNVKPWPQLSNNNVSGTNPKIFKSLLIVCSMRIFNFLKWAYKAHFLWLVEWLKTPHKFLPRNHVGKKSIKFPVWIKSCSVHGTPIDNHNPVCYILPKLGLARNMCKVDVVIEGLKRYLSRCICWTVSSPPSYHIPSVRSQTFLTYNILSH